MDIMHYCQATVDTDMAMILDRDADGTRCHSTRISMGARDRNIESSFSRDEICGRQIEVVRYLAVMETRLTVRRSKSSGLPIETGASRQK